jgi:hypothetical protein
VVVDRTLFSALSFIRIGPVCRTVPQALQRAPSVENAAPATDDCMIFYWFTMFN